jgi:hypothetical protein
MCGSHAPVTWPAAEDDPDYGVFDLSPPIGADDDAPYGRPVTSADHVSQQDLYEDGRNLGPVLGHYWPPSTFSFGNWPQDARRDPSNGERDPIYYFYLDPTFGGIVSRDNGGRPDPGGTSNAWINAFFSQWSAIFVALGI